MRLALLYPEPEKGGRGNKKKSGETPGFSQSRLKAARTVYAFSHELALLYPEQDKRGRGNKGKAAETSDFSQRRFAVDLGVAFATVVFFFARQPTASPHQPASR